LLPQGIRLSSQKLSFLNIFIKSNTVSYVIELTI
jgi:hypothetical protein